LYFDLVSAVVGRPKTAEIEPYLTGRTAFPMFRADAEADSAYPVAAQG
jgi:hypothetical protein